jgi:hypothetical protein
MAFYRRAARVLAEVIDGRAALVNPEGTELLTLNPVGTLVWESIGDGSALDSIVEQVVAACAPVEDARVSVDVERFLAELAGLGLVVAEG